MALLITPSGEMLSSPLTPRERDVLELIGQGLRQSQIAAQLRISPQTSRTHTKNAYRKLGVSNKVDALRQAGML